MGAEFRQAAVGEDADVPLLAAGDLGDLSVGKTLAPEFDRLGLGGRKLGEEPMEAGGEIVRLGDERRVGLTTGGGWLGRLPMGVLAVGG